MARGGLSYGSWTSGDVCEMGSHLLVCVAGRRAEKRYDIVDYGPTYERKGKLCFPRCTCSSTTVCISSFVDLTIALQASISPDISVSRVRLVTVDAAMSRYNNYRASASYEPAGPTSPFRLNLTHLKASNKSALLHLDIRINNRHTLRLLILVSLSHRHDTVHPLRLGMIHCPRQQPHPVMSLPLVTVHLHQ